MGQPNFDRCDGRLLVCCRFQRYARQAEHPSRHKSSMRSFHADDRRSPVREPHPSYCLPESSEHNAETAGKYAEVEKALKWIVESDKYPELKPLASVRLAGVYLDEGKYDQGLAVLNAVKDAKGEEVPVYDRMGDLYLAKGDAAAARKSWEDALRHAPMTNPLVGVIEIKLNSLPKE